MFVWGLSIPATKVALADFPPLTLTAARYVAAAPCFALFMRFRPLPPVRDLWALAGLGLLGIDAGQILQSLGVVRTAASVATMLSATSPMFIAGFAALFLRQPVLPRHLAGMAVALAGVATVVWDGQGPAGADMTGNLLVLSSTASIAAYYVLASGLIARHGVITVGGWSCLFGALGLLPPAAWEMTVRPVHPTVVSVLIILYLGALVTVAGLWIWLNMLRRVPVRVAASTQSLQPLFGIAGSALWLGEPIGLRFAIGAVLVLTGIGVTVMPRRGA
jgi:drug/metabolite transporter (DMT)-like permease